MTLIVILTILATAISGTMHAATHVAAPDSMRLTHRPSPWIGIATGVGMLGTTVAARQSYPHSYSITPTGMNPDRGTDLLQYAPLVTPWLLKAAGVPTRSGWGRMAVSQGIATALMVGTIKGLKESVHSLRPDGSDYDSFPSGHAAFAFMGATMMARELGQLSPWYAIGAYAVATGVAVERAIDCHHFPTDIVAGADIGIISAQLGYLVGDMLFGDRQSGQSQQDECLNSNFSYLALQTGLALPLGPIHAGETHIQRLPALSASLRGGWAISEHWGLGVELGLLSTPLITEVQRYRTHVKSQSSLSVLITPYYIYPISNRVSLTTEAAAGYRHNLPLDLDDSSIETGTSSPMGRVNVGCVLRFSPKFSAQASVGYEMSRYRFTVRPSTAYHIPAAASTRGLSSTLLINLSSLYEF